MAAPVPQVIPGSNAPSAVVYVAVARVSDRAILAQRAEKLSSEELQKFEDTLSQLLDQAAKLPIYPGWKDKTQIGVDIEANCGAAIHALADPQALSVVAVGVQGQQYPERVVCELLHELTSKVRLTVSAERFSEAKPKTLTSDLAGELKEAMKKYSDPAKVDKVASVHEKVDQVKGLMQDNVKKILETHATLEHLQNQSQSMTASADIFVKQSTAVKRQALWQNLRVKIAIGASVTVVALVTMFPLLNAVGVI